MIPKIVMAAESPQVTKYADNTYKLDFEKKRISGKTEGLEAIKQAIYKVLQTERYAYLIYSWSYGAELERFIGKDFDYVRAAVEGEIKESLYMDDRILNITDFKIEKTGLDSCLVSFHVQTTAGFTDIHQEVEL